jgi:formylmethanofuran dehydrogenase subunit E
MYKENSEFKMICKSMILQIEESKILKNDKFNVCIDTIANAVCNPLKISYIKKDKIIKLIEHAGIVISEPTTEQRNKYYNACTLRKFANNYFLTDGISAEQLQEFNNIVTEATAAANLLLPKTFHVLDAEHIPQIYNLNQDKEKTHLAYEAKIKGSVKSFYIGEKSDINASCMQGKPLSYFEIYNDINTDASTLKIAILTQGNEIVARSLVWIDKPEADIDRRKKMQPNEIFIDRIYTKTQDHRAETQTQLFNEVHKYFNVNTIQPKTNDSGQIITDAPTNIRFANCFNWYDIKSKVTEEQKTREPVKFLERTVLMDNKEIFCSSSPLFDVEVNSDSYSYYPYADTFHHFNTYNQTLSNDECSDSDILRLNNVSGEASENTRCCDECGSETHEDDATYIDDDFVCGDCAVFCDDRDESIRESDAIYNNCTGIYHHRDDLDI